MAVTKLIKLATDGTQSEYTGLNTSVGSGSASEFIIADSSGKLDPSFLPTGVGSDAITLTTGETIASGDFVYISAAGFVFKADATTPAKQARGYVLAGAATSGTVLVYFDDNNTSVTGLTPGSTYYLSDTTPGGVVTPAPTPITGHICQQVGFASTATSLHVNIERPVTRA
ncbi:MAG: hypothetical protein ABIP51_20875 [Bacteroidia bacterium]